MTNPEPAVPTMPSTGLPEIEERVREAHQVVRAIRDNVARIIVGQHTVIDRLLVGLLSRGHLLLEGVPGLAKTTAVQALADSLALEFRRVQFTPDLLPADVIGTQIYNPREASFTTHEGPVFANIVLADEINRAPAKVQSALLEAMQERQVTLGGRTLALPTPFLVLATQNPIEQEGTYPLPEAQADRFMLKIRVDYPSRDEERAILDRSREAPERLDPVATVDDLTRCQQAMNLLRMESVVSDYVVEVVRATRDPASCHSGLERFVEYGASPRATLALAAGARAHAFLEGRGYVTPDDVKEIGPDVLRHRVLLTYEAEAEGLDVDQVIGKIFQSVKTP
ncbi:MAG: AAA family ATPase [Myxococcota bacterium]|nr:AAA family ATPase [Myxococcota bacterium]